MKNKLNIYIEELHKVIDQIKQDDIDDVLHILKFSEKIFICGNGGSSSTASHLAQDLNKMCGIHTICLSDNIPMITALSNDESYDDIFMRQLQMMATPNDTLIVLSGSGNSKNIIKAIEYANSIDIMTIALIGMDGGKIKKDNKVDKIIHITGDMQHSEDWHLIVGHILCQILME